MEGSCPDDSPPARQGPSYRRPENRTRAVPARPHGRTDFETDGKRQRSAFSGRHRTETGSFGKPRSLAISGSRSENRTLLQQTNCPAYRPVSWDPASLSVPCHDRQGTPAHAILRRPFAGPVAVPVQPCLSPLSGMDSKAADFRTNPAPRRLQKPENKTAGYGKTGRLAVIRRTTPSAASHAGRFPFRARHATRSFSRIHFSRTASNFTISTGLAK